MNNIKKTIGELFLASGSSILLLFLISCAKSPYRVLNSRDVDRISFGAIAPGEETNYSIRNIGQLIQFDTFRDTTYYARKDSSLIRRYVSFLNKLVPLEEDGTIDMRIFSIVTMNDGVQHINCYGYSWGTLYDGLYMEDHKDLFSFLDSLIYAHHNKNYWVPEWYKNQSFDNNDSIPYSKKSEESTEERVNTIPKRNKVILGDKLIKVTIEYNREDTFCSIDEDGEYLEGLLKHRHNRIIITDTPTLNFFESWKKRVVDSLTDEPCEYYLTSLKAVIYYYKHHSDTLCLKRYPSKIQFNHLKSMDSTYFFMVNSYLNLVDSTWRKNNGWVYEENSEIRDKYSCIPYTDKPWPQIAIPKQIKED